MTPKKARPRACARSIALATLLACLQQAQAADLAKANNTTALNAAGSWAGNVVPTVSDIAAWDSTVTGANSVNLGGNVTFGGIRVTNPGGDVTINLTAAAQTLTIGPTSGSATTIDLSAATHDLTIGNVVGQGSFRGNGSGQVWLVAAGRTLTVNSNLTTRANTTSLTFGDATSTGNIVVNGSASPGATPLGFSVQGANITLNGANQWRVTTNAFNITSGTLNLGNALALDAQTAATSFGLNGGTLTASGGTRSVTTDGGFSLGGNITVADHAGGAHALALASDLTVNGGNRTITNNSTGGFTLANVGLANNATARTLTFDGTGGTTVSGVVASNGTTNSNGTAFTGSSIGGSIIKNGAGTLIFSANNTYAGTTTVNAGLLLVNGVTGGQGAFTINGGGLGGLGTIGTNNANVTFADGVTLSPGSVGAGNLSFALGSGVLDLSTMTAAGAFVFDLAGDKITVVSGSLNLGAITASEFSFTNIAAGSFTLFDTSASIVSTVVQSGKFSLGSGFEGEFGFANGGQDFVLTVATSAVPEPASAACLAGLALLGFAAVRRRR